MKKILVVGTSGSGKSTLARNIARILGIKDIELDALHWGPNWAEADPEEFKGRVLQAMRCSDGFVIHGNYNKIRDTTWGAVNTVIWLDYPRPVVMWRVISRTLRRILTREELWSGNVESFRKSFLDKDSIILWAWNTYDTRKEQYARLFEENPYHIKTLLRFRRPREARAFLREIAMMRR